MGAVHPLLGSIAAPDTAVAEAGNPTTLPLMEMLALPFNSVEIFTPVMRHFLAAVMVAFTPKTILTTSPIAGATPRNGPDAVKLPSINPGSYSARITPPSNPLGLHQVVTSTGSPLSSRSQESRHISTPPMEILAYLPVIKTGAGII